MLLCSGIDLVCAFCARSQVLLVPAVLVPDAAVLHILRHDGCRGVAARAAGRRHLLRLLLRLVPLCGLPHSPPGALGLTLLSVPLNRNTLLCLVCSQNSLEERMVSHHAGPQEETSSWVLSNARR